MNTIACHTLGCKVNQYDTEAMLELFEKAGYRPVDFHQEADVYLINTCTVTGTGDAKSMKLIRRIHRLHPEAAIVVAGCLAQRDAQRVMLDGVRLVVGNQMRGQVVRLLERAVAENRIINAVDGFKKPEFDPPRGQDPRHHEDSGGLRPLLRLLHYSQRARAGALHAH